MSFDIAFQQLPEEQFQFLLKNGKRTSILLDYDFNSLVDCSYEFLKEILPDLAKKGNFEKLVWLMFADRGIQQFTCDIERIDYNDMLSFIFWIMDERESIAKMENEYLRNEPDPDMMAAGINEMEILGDIPAIYELANKDITKMDSVKKMKYSQIFDIQLMLVIQSRIEKRLIKIKQTKAKSKNGHS